MLNEIINIITGILFLISVIFIGRTLKEQRLKNKIETFTSAVSKENSLRIKLNEYDEKIRKSKNSAERIFLWNDRDALLFNFFEHISILILSNSVDEKQFKAYFKRILIDISEIFYDEEGLLKRGYISQLDYPHLIKLFQRWNI
ncbi:MAG: hypothetical protein KJ592_02910 [Nanoarchaeota archaeon]|nr:hypothetical protein [Nanoarchaeota archaeon]